MSWTDGALMHRSALVTAFWYELLDCIMDVLWNCDLFGIDAHLGGHWYRRMSWKFTGRDLGDQQSLGPEINQYYATQPSPLSFYFCKRNVCPCS